MTNTSNTPIAPPSTLIVNYHYCVGETENPYLARTAVSPVLFAKQVKQLAALQTTHGVAPLVTFDDGTRDVWRNAVPILKQHGVPFILFFCSLPLLEKRLLNVTKIHLLQAKLGLPAFKLRFMTALKTIQQSFELDDPARFNLGRIYRYDTHEAREFKLLLNVKLPYPVVTQVLDTLFEPEFGSQAQAVPSLYMTNDDILRARDAGAKIGLHTHSHFMLGRLSNATQETEIQTCQHYFRDLLGQQAFELSYPYGVPGTWNAHTKSVLSKLGIEQAYTLGRQLHHANNEHDALEIPRFDVNDVFTREGVFKSEASTPA
ncbi:MAG: polysaccharide deacetylase family protein [Limnobacter sp.]|nr:polysaccharide deacetylase family protein [Limnobacter sp.]